MTSTVWNKTVKSQRKLSFRNPQWLKKYIKFDAEKRKNKDNNFKKDFFKLIKNRLYDKTMENLRNTVNVRFGTHAKKYEKLVCKPRFVLQNIFYNNLVAVHKI